MMATMSTQQLLTPRALRVDEFCERYCVGRSTFWKYVKLGRIRIITIGGRTVVPPSEVDRIDRDGVPVASKEEERAVA
jgi:predicted site-specific integrase-resolvase